MFRLFTTWFRVIKTGSGKPAIVFSGGPTHRPSVTLSARRVAAWRLVKPRATHYSLCDR